MTIGMHLQSIRPFLFLVMHTPDPLKELFMVQEASHHALAYDVLYGHTMNCVSDSVFPVATHHNNCDQENPETRSLEMGK